MDKPAAVPELTKQSPYEVEVTAPSLTGVHTIQTMNRPAANQVSKSAEQVADEQKLTIDRVIYLLNEWGYPEARRRFIELRSAMSSQTASAASPVAGVSQQRDYHFSDEQVMEALVGTDYLREHVRLMLVGRTSGEKWSLYRAIVKLAQPSAEGDGNND